MPNKKQKTGEGFGEPTQTNESEGLSYVDHLMQKSLQQGTIFVTGFVGLDMSEKIALEIEQLANLGMKKIKVIICSQGGSVFAGLAIFDALENFKSNGGKVITEARGFAASMGAVILQAGTKRYASKNTRILIHEVSGSSFAGLTASTAEEEAKELKRVNQQLVDILADRSGLSSKKVLSLVKKRDYWMTATEAKDLHFIDEIS